MRRQWRLDTTIVCTSDRSLGLDPTMRDESGSCQNIYRFLRLRLGDDISDREIARRWGMDWKGFTLLKSGKRRVPRLDELEALAILLDVDAAIVFEVARGVPAASIYDLLAHEDLEQLSALLTTGLRHARATPRPPAHLFRASLDRANDAVFTVDVQGRFRHVNSSLVQLLGYSEEELLGLTLFEPLNFISYAIMCFI